MDKKPARAKEGPVVPSPTPSAVATAPMPDISLIVDVKVSPIPQPTPHAAKRPAVHDLVRGVEETNIAPAKETIVMPASLSKSACSKKDKKDKKEKKEKQLTGKGSKSTVSTTDKPPGAIAKKKKMFGKKRICIVM